MKGLPKSLGGESVSFTDLKMNLLEVHFQICGQAVMAVCSARVSRIAYNSKKNYKNIRIGLKNGS